VKSTVAWRSLGALCVFTILFPTLKCELTDRFAGEDSQRRNERAVEGMRYPTLCYRMLVFLRLVVPAVCREMRCRQIGNQRKLNRLEEFEYSGYYRVGAPRYFF